MLTFNSAQQCQNPTALDLGYLHGNRNNDYVYLSIGVSLMVFLLFLKTYRMDGRGHVDMKPDSGVIEAKVGTDEESGTGGCGVAPIGHRIFHVCHG